MQFLTPLFWVAAAAIAIPIILHLTRRETRNPIPFSSLMFVRRLPVQEVRKRRLRNIFLLFLRCLAVLLVVAAFAQPIIERSWLASANPVSARSVVLLFDNSMSMSRSGVWSEGLRQARVRLEQLRPGDEGLIIQFSDAVQMLSRWEKDSVKLLGSLSQLEPSFGTTSYEEGLRLAAEQFQEASNEKREIVLITDLQASGLNFGARVDLPSNLELTVIDVATEETNFYIDEARLQRNIFHDQYPHDILIRIGARPPSVRSGRLLLYLENELVDQKNVEIASTGAATVTISPFTVAGDITRGKLVLDIDDSLEADNSYHFVLHRSQPFRVRLIGTEAESLYLKNALESGSNLAFDVARSAAPSRLEAEGRLIILNNLETPPGGDYQRFVESGGGLILAAGADVRADAYRQRLGEILPATLLEKNYVRSRAGGFTSITEVTWEHPIFSVFQDSQRASLLEAHFFSYWKIQPTAGSQVLARFSNGDPALVEKRIGEGRVLLFSSTLDRIWTDFPLRASYVPFWQKAVEYASGWQFEPASMQVNQVLSLAEVAADLETGQSRSWDIVDPTGERVLGLRRETPDFLPLQIPGFYEVRSNKKTDWIAVNTDSSESDLTRLREGEFLAAVRQIDPATRSRPGGSSDPANQPLWWLFLMLAALVLIFEAAVANRLKSEANRRTAG